jgi:hypothetical protein
MLVDLIKAALPDNFCRGLVKLKLEESTIQEVADDRNVVFAGLSQRHLVRVKRITPRVPVVVLVQSGHPEPAFANGCIDVRNDEKLICVPLTK